MKNQIEALVVEVQDKVAKVKLSRHGECSHCGACAGSGAILVEACNEIGAQPGERVLLEVEEGNMLQSAFVVYLLPIIAVIGGSIAGFWLAQWLGRMELSLEILGGGVCFTISLLYIRRFEQVLKAKPVLPMLIRDHSAY